MRHPFVWLLLNMGLLGLSTVGSVFGLLFLRDHHALSVTSLDVLVFSLYAGIYTMLLGKFLSSPSKFNLMYAYRTSCGASFPSLR